MKVNFDDELYSDLCKLAYTSDLEYIMLIGGNMKNNDIITYPSTFKMFKRDELTAQTSDSASIKKKVLVAGIKEILNRGYNTIIMIHTHPCKTLVDDWLYASLSPEELEGQKNVQLVCQLQNANFFSGVATCGGVYFWRIDQDSMKPVQVDCALNGKIVEKKVPATLKELLIQFRK